MAELMLAIIVIITSTMRVCLCAQNCNSIAQGLSSHSYVNK